MGSNARDNEAMAFAPPFVGEGAKPPLVVCDADDVVVCVVCVTVGGVETTDVPVVIVDGGADNDGVGVPVELAWSDKVQASFAKSQSYLDLRAIIY
jgi:hypothetical protein